MRSCVLLAALLLVGCSPTASETPAAAQAPVAAGAAESPAKPKPTTTESPATTPAAGTTNVAAASSLPDLGTRKFGGDWPTFLGPTHNSISPEKNIRTNWPSSGPKIVWTAPLGTSYGMPSISRGRLFQFHRFGAKARLSCLESETGKELWQFEYPTEYEDLYGYNDGPRGSPVIDDDRVYLFGVEGTLHCLKAVDGSVLWKVDTQADFGVVQNFFGVGSSPVVEGDLLIVMIGGSPADSPPISTGRVRGNGSGIVAFNKHTGKVVYQITDELASYSSPVLATIGNRRWCFVFARGGLVAFDPATGKVDFQYPWRATLLESVNAANPVVVGDLVFISEAYDPKRGSALLRVKPGGYYEVWTDAARREKSLQLHWNTPIHHQGYLYGCSARHSPEAELRCIELATGKVMWSEPGMRWSSLLYADGHLICLSEDGTLRLLKANPEKYDEAAEVVLRDEAAPQDPFGLGRPPLLRSPAWAAPILSHGLLYVRGNGRLVCLELMK